MAVEVELGAYLTQPYMKFFSHNPLHDLESLWWVGVWFLLCHYPPSDLRDITVQDHIKVVKNFGWTLFNNGIDPISRRRTVLGSYLLAKIQPLSFPKAVQHLIVLLHLFREQLVAHYELYKPTMTSQDLSFFNPDIHRKYGDLVEKAIKKLRDDETALWLIGHIEKSIAVLDADSEK